MDKPGDHAAVDELLSHFGERVSRLYIAQRLGLEADKEARIFGQGLNFFHPENWYALSSILGGSLRVMGLYRRGLANALAIEVNRNRVRSTRLPPALSGFTLLQLSDLHLDMHPDYPAVLAETVRPLQYDACVLTGDYRFRTAGSWRVAIEGLRRVRLQLSDPVYAILGNHDCLALAPAMEDLGIQVLLNEWRLIEGGTARLQLVGIDDPHYYRSDNLDKACQGWDPALYSILLCHSPELYRQAAHAGFDLMLSGHSHGGQICLPGGIPLMLNANCPRRFALGAWRYHGLDGFTSVGCGSSIVPVRYFCPPEVNLHCLEHASH